MTWPPHIMIPATAALLLLPIESNRAQSSCPAAPPPNTTPFSDSLVSDLNGTFRLFVVTTSYPGSGPTIDSGWTLRIASVDSARRAEATQRRIGVFPRKQLQMEGRALPNNAGWQPQPAEVDSGILYMGCRDCVDASPLVFRPQWRSERGFGGTWRDYQTGIGRVVDREGKWAPDPAGHFCAVRVPNRE